MDAVIIILLVIVGILAAINIAISLKSRGGSVVSEELERRFTTIDTSFSKIDSLIREEFARNREELRNADERKCSLQFLFASGKGYPLT